MALKGNDILVTVCQEMTADLNKQGSIPAMLIVQKTKNKMMSSLYIPSSVRLSQWELEIDLRHK